MTHSAPQQPGAIEPAVHRIALAPRFGDEFVTLAYAEWSPAPGKNLKGTVVAVHGLTRQKRDFDFIAESLASAGYRVIAPDAPGRGESSRFEDPQLYGVDIYAGVFAAFLDTMQLPRVHWIGTSMGGLIALAMAMGFGGSGLEERFETLTLVDITHRPSRQGLDRITAYITENLPTFSGPEQYEAALRQNLPLGDVDDRVWHHYAQHQLRLQPDGRYAFHFDPKIARRALPELKGDIDLTLGLEKINCPLALVAGGVSDLCTLREIDDFMTLKPAALLHVVPGAGHVPALSDDATQQFILQALARG